MTKTGNNGTKHKSTIKITLLKQDKKIADKKNIPKKGKNDKKGTKTRTKWMTQKIRETEGGQENVTKKKATREGEKNSP